MPDRDIAKREPSLPAENKRSPGVVASVVRDCVDWRPAPLKPPEIDERILEWDPLSQAGEAVRFQVSRLEYWLSPTGVLRSWLKVCIKTGICLALIGLVMAPLTGVFRHAAECAAVIRATAMGLLETAVMLVAMLFLVRFAGAVWRQWNERTRDERDYTEY
jgi:hypothetical protein